MVLLDVTNSLEMSCFVRGTHPEMDYFNGQVFMNSIFRQTGHLFYERLL